MSDSSPSLVQSRVSFNIHCSVKCALPWQVTLCLFPTCIAFAWSIMGNMTIHKTGSTKYTTILPEIDQAMISYDM